MRKNKVEKNQNNDINHILNEESKYICLTDGALLISTPEESVRQNFIVLE